MSLFTYFEKYESINTSKFSGKLTGASVDYSKHIYVTGSNKVRHDDKYIYVALNLSQMARIVQQ